MSADTTPRARAAEPAERRQQKPSSLGRDLPRVPRRYGQWAGAVLFVAMAVVLAGWFWQQRDDRVAVLVVSEPVPAGEVLTAEDLEVIDVSGVDGAIASADSARVIGSHAAVGLVQGQVLTADMVTSEPIPGPEERVVGMQLDSTRAPMGLVPGDLVIVVAVPPSGDPGTPGELDSPDVLAEQATVVHADLIEGAGTRLSLLVPDTVGERIVAYVAAGRVAVIQAPTGGDG